MPIRLAAEGKNLTALSKQCGLYTLGLTVWELTGREVLTCTNLVLEMKERINSDINGMN